MKKILLIISLLILTGCNKTDIKNTYENMIDKSYEMDIKVNGINENNRINDSTRITNYKNKEYKILYLNEDKLIYKFNNKLYIKESNEYKEINDTNYYTNPNLYLDLLKNIKKINSKTEETINNIKYNVYDVSVNKDSINKLLQNTKLNGKKTNNDVACKLYITNDKKLYRTNCDLKNYLENTNNIRIDITYFNIEKVNKII